MAKGPEAIFWSWLSANMSAYWVVQRHEDKISVGIPDLSYAINGVDGWIELKAYNKWPTDKLPHYTAKQKNWLIERGTAGNGNCFILIKIKKTVMLFSWLVADNLFKGPCHETNLRWLAQKTWDNGFKISEFVRLIS